MIPPHPIRARARGLTRAAAIIAAVIGAFSFGRDARCEPPAADPRSVEWIVANQPDRVRALFEALNLDRPGLATVRQAVAADDYPGACRALLAYFRSAPTARWLRRNPVAESDRTDPYAQAIVADRFTFGGREATLPRTRNGTIDWSYNGPANDPEWGWQLNDLGHLATLTQAYLRTGRREYLVRADADARDWILSNPNPGRMVVRGPWRGIDVAARARNWMFTFYALQNCDEFSPAARLLMLSSLSEHAQYLLLFHRRDAGNWTVTELDGLAAIGAGWPEFRDAGGWRAFALERMGAQAAEQVYPDGAHTTLAGHDHRIAAEQFDGFVKLFREFRYQVPDSLRAGVQQMWSYLALSLRPDGTTPEHNGCDRRDARERLIEAARAHDRPDWTYVATNGRSGAPPVLGPSVVFPWAGQAVMRSGWQADAQWSIFDIGPLGTGEHPHRDKLHLSVDAFGRALLVDTGCDGDGEYGDYFTGSSAHNVILVDGGGQKAGPTRALDALAASEYGSQPGWDYARGVFASGFEGAEGEAIHTRAVIYVHDRFWVVADRIETDRERRVEALWHFAPDCTVEMEKRSVFTTDAEKGNLRIVPVGGMPWRVDVVAGREEPGVQGWYSGHYNEKVPAPTAVYSAVIPGTTTFTWVLVPGRGDVPAPEATVVSSRPERVELRVRLAAGQSFLVTVPMNEWRPSVRAES